MHGRTSTVRFAACHGASFLADGKRCGPGHWAGPGPVRCPGRTPERNRGPMSRISKIAEIPAGSWTKWLVVGFWVAVVAVAFPLSGKLMGAEQNDASKWLPAESTKVLHVQAHFQSPNIFPAVVVYTRASGLTAADRVKAAADARA